MAIATHYRAQRGASAAVTLPARGDALGCVSMHSAPNALRAGAGRRRGVRAPGLRRTALGAAAAWLLLALSALTAGDGPLVAWISGVLVIVVASVALARVPAWRRATVPAVGLYAAFMTAATLLAGGGAWPGAGEAARVQILTGNPNVLAAALVSAFAAFCAAAPRRALVWWGWPLVALAVLYTGSRTAGGALLAAGIVWLVAPLLTRRRWLLLAPLAAAVALALAAVLWQRAVVESTPNLLAAPSDLAHVAWNHSRAEHLAITDGASPGPFEGTSAQRLVARAAPDSRLTVYQSIGRSELGVPYVASIYLRADEPQQVVLSSHLARVTCEVGPEWRRCVTPVGHGNDLSQRQLHLRTVELGGEIDVFVFGAQYERGHEATPFVDARPAWLPQAMLNRYDLRRLTFLPHNRAVPMRAGLAIARAHPAFGIGRSASAEAFRERTRAELSAPLDYAHNLPIQLLAVHGAVGTLGWLLLLGALLLSIPAPGLVRLAPLFVALVILNAYDVTFFEPVAFVPALLAVAHRTARPPGGGADPG
jgi:hypothetical protein